MKPKTIGTSALAAFTASPALAHPGDHGALAMDALAAHVMGSAFHAGLIAVIAGLCGIIAWRLVKAERRSIRLRDRRGR